MREEANNLFSITITVIIIMLLVGTCVGGVYWVYDFIDQGIGSTSAYSVIRGETAEIEPEVIPTPEPIVVKEVHQVYVEDERPWADQHPIALTVIVVAGLTALTVIAVAGIALAFLLVKRVQFEKTHKGDVSFVSENDIREQESVYE